MLATIGNMFSYLTQAFNCQYNFRSLKEHPWIRAKTLALAVCLVEVIMQQLRDMGKERFTLIML